MVPSYLIEIRNFCKSNSIITKSKIRAIARIIACITWWSRKIILQHSSSRGGRGVILSTNRERGHWSTTFI